MNTKVIIISDQNTPQERELADALQQSDEITVPRSVLHLSEVGRVKEFIRAEPAVGVLIMANSMQEAVAIADVVKLSALMEAKDTLLDIASTHVTDAEALTIPLTLYKEWDGAETGAIKAGEIVRYKGKLYRCPVGVDKPVSSKRPGTVGMMATYRPIRAKDGEDA